MIIGLGSVFRRLVKVLVVFLVILLGLMGWYWDVSFSCFVVVLMF